ncbi:hypothetical protein FOFC_16295 [Fusarium oxysporum]|nr:hypothetical protein FOFC_16295 [Fusarium oxysporum]
MTQSMVPAEIVISIIFGILQLIVGLVSLWQQHYFRWAARKSWITIFNHKNLTRQKLADVEDEETLSENPIKLKPSRLEKVWA